MKKLNMKWILSTAGAIVVSWALLFAFTASATSTSQKVKDAKEELEESKEELEESQQTVEEMENAKAQLEGKLAELNDELKEVSSQLETSQAELTAKQQAIDEIRIELVSAEAIEAEQYESMKKRIKFMYENNSNNDALQMILEGEDFADMLNKADFIQKMTEYDRKMLKEYSEMKEAIALAKATLEEEEKALQIVVAEVEKKQSEINHLVNQTAEEISRQSENLAEAEARALAYEKKLIEQQNTLEALEAKEAEEKRILAEQERLKQQASAGTSSGTSAGTINYDSNGKVVGSGSDKNLTTSAGGYSEATNTSDLKLLATIIYCEAGNQPYEGQIAVGSVVMNRINSPLFPNTMVGVLYQKSQFTPVMSGRFAIALANNSATQACYSAAQEVLNGRNNVPDCLFFRTVTPSKKGTIIGDHVFY